jgi:hypothetical protein
MLGDTTFLSLFLLSLFSFVLEVEQSPQGFVRRVLLRPPASYGISGGYGIAESGDVSMEGQPSTASSRGPLKVYPRLLWALECVATLLAKPLLYSSVAA